MRCRKCLNADATRSIGGVPVCLPCWQSNTVESLTDLGGRATCPAGPPGRFHRYGGVSRPGHPETLARLEHYRDEHPPTPSAIVGTGRN